MTRRGDITRAVIAILAVCLLMTVVRGADSSGSLVLSTGLFESGDLKLVTGPSEPLTLDTEFIFESVGVGVPYSELDTSTSDIEVEDEVNLIKIVEGLTATTGEPLTAEIAEEPKKPYLHKDSSNDHWICSKHGDLDKWKDGYVIISPHTFDASRATIYDITYCHRCYWESQIKLINQYITGVKE